MLAAPFLVDTNFAMLAPRLNQLIAAISEILQTPAPVAVHAGLTAIGFGLNLRRVRVTTNGRRHQRPVYFPMLIAPSGLSKSPAVELALRAVRKYDERMLVRHSEAIDLWPGQHEVWKATRTRLRQDMRKDAAVAPLLAAHERQRPKKPQLRTFFIADGTFSAIVDQLVDGRAHLFVSDEMHKLKRSGLMRDGRIAPLYGGELVTDNSRTNGLVIAAGYRLVMSIALQPHEFQIWNAASEGSLRGSGALARLTWMYTMPNFDLRDFSRDRAAAHSVVDEFEKWMANQLEQYAEVAQQEEEIHRFSVEAVDVYSRWEAWLQARQLPGGKLHAIRDAGTKAADQVVHIATAIEWFESGGTTVGPKAVRAAIMLVEMSLNNYHMLVGPESTAPIAGTWAPRLLDWLKTQLTCAWWTKRIVVLKADCPTQVCPLSHWQPAIEELEHQKLVCTRKGDLALTPRAWGLLMPGELPMIPMMTQSVDVPSARLLSIKSS